MRAWIHPAWCHWWHENILLSPTEHHLNPTESTQVLLYTMYPSSDDCFEQDKTPCFLAQNISNWFCEHDERSDMNPVEHLSDAV